MFLYRGSKYFLSQEIDVQRSRKQTTIWFSAHLGKIEKKVAGALHAVKWSIGTVRTISIIRYFEVSISLGFSWLLLKVITSVEYIPSLRRFLVITQSNNQESAVSLAYNMSIY